MQGGERGLPQLPQRFACADADTRVFSLEGPDERRDGCPPHVDEFVPLLFRYQVLCTLQVALWNPAQPVECPCRLHPNPVRRIIEGFDQHRLCPAIAHLSQCFDSTDADLLLRVPHRPDEGQKSPGVMNLPQRPCRLAPDPGVSAGEGLDEDRNGCSLEFCKFRPIFQDVVKIDLLLKIVRRPPEPGKHAGSLFPDREVAVMKRFCEMRDRLPAHSLEGDDGGTPDRRAFVVQSG